MNEEGRTQREGKFKAFTYEGTEGFTAYGVRFPSGKTIVEWDSESGPDDAQKITGSHQSVYESWGDFRTVCTGEVTHEWYYAQPTPGDYE